MMSLLKVLTGYIASQGTILSRNSPGLIMNEGNLIIQQVSKESAGIYHLAR